MKIGILGAGHIAEKMAKTINAMEDEYELYAVGASNTEKAQRFAGEHNIPKVYGSYQELAQDKDIDLIYVATIHTMHFEHALLCLENGKNVLVEKPFAVNAKQAEILFNKAKEKNLLISEAIWTRYMPSGNFLKSIKVSGIIGEVKSVQGTIGYPLEHKHRMISPECAGGALLDVGVYALHLGVMVFGDDYTLCTGECLKLESGVDGIDSVTMKWDNAIATLHATMVSQTGNAGFVFGTEGYLKIDNINNPKIITRYDNGHNQAEVYDFSDQITGFEYQVKACCNAVKEGKTECEDAPHNTTLKIIQAMDSLLESWGIFYPVN